MGGMDINMGSCLSGDPSVTRPSAGKDKRMCTFLVNDGQFEIAIERSGANSLPHKPIKGPTSLHPLIWIIPSQKNVSRTQFSLMDAEGFFS